MVGKNNHTDSAKQRHTALPKGHAKTVLSITPIVLIAGLSWRSATHSMDYDALPHDEGALSYFAKRKGIKRIYVDVDETLLIKKPLQEAKSYKGSIDLEASIHNKHQFGFEDESRNQVIINERLIKQLIVAQEAGTEIHVLKDCCTTCTHSGRLSMLQ